MKDQSVICKLFYLLVHADQEVNEKELELGNKMVDHEGLDAAIFQRELKELEKVPVEIIFDEVLEGLFKFSTRDQINYIAWMSLIANGDGFMDKREWELIYSLYKKNLDLSLEDIMNRQRELNMIVSKKSQKVY